MHSEAILAYDPAAAKTTDTGLVAPSPVDLSACEAREFKIRSDDGVQIPLSLIMKKGQPLDGNAPTLLTAYGANGANLYPNFAPQTLAWLERGGIIAVAHVRGGGELGEDWHARRPETPQGKLDPGLHHGWAVARGSASTPRRRGSGARARARAASWWAARSRGGQTFSRRSSARRAGSTPCARSFLPPVRRTSRSSARSKEPDGFKALATVDAYQAVKDGVAYPAVLLTAGINDPRVPVWQPAKMAARLQAASRGGKPVLLRVDDGAGQGGAGKNQAASKTADEYAFLLWQFGLPDFRAPTR